MVTKKRKARPMINRLISQIMKEVGAIEKKRRPEGGLAYAFRSIDEVIDRVHPLFVKRGIFITPEVIDRTVTDQIIKGERKEQRLVSAVVTVKHTFHAPDGSSMFATTVGEASDYSDKASNKAQSYALKFAICTVLCIPFSQFIDGDGDNPDASGKAIGAARSIAQPRSKSEAAASAAPAGRQQRGGGPAGGQRSLVQDERHTPPGDKISDQQAKVIYGRMEKAALSTGDLFKRFNVMRIADLRTSQLNEVHAWIDNPQAK